jgi:hypothetical protein
LTSTNNQGVSAAQVAGNSPYTPGTGTSNFGVPTNNNNPWGTIFSTSNNAASIGGAVTASTAGRHQHSIPALSVSTSPAGGGLGHQNIGPSTGMNLFVKT